MICVPGTVATAITGTSAHLRSTGHVKAHAGAELSPSMGQLRRLQHRSSTPNAVAWPRIADTSAWVERVLTSEVKDHASRGLVTHLFQSLTNMLHLIKGSASRTGRRRASMERYQQLLASLHVLLPQAIAVLAGRAAYLATSESVPLGERMHAPVALMLYSSTLHAAPAALCRQVMHEEELASGKQALQYILVRCIRHRMFSSKSKFASMTSRSFILLLDAGVWPEGVRKAQAEFLGRVSTAGVKQFDIEAVADLCSLVAAFKAAPGQRKPRAWYIAMERLKEIVSDSDLHLPAASKIAGSVARMQHTLHLGLQAAVIRTGRQCVEEPPSKAPKPTDIADYLVAAAQLQLPVPKDVVKVCFPQLDA